MHPKKDTSRERPARRTGARVLIVDDHPLSRNSVALMLKLRGYDVLAVATAEEALASITTFAPDVVVLEWAFRGMPERGRGLSATMRTRSALLGRALSVIVTSHVDEPHGFRDEEDVEAYFTKPVAPHVLDSAITSALAARTRTDR